MRIYIGILLVLGCFQYGHSQLFNIAGVDTFKLLQRAIKCPNAVKGLSLISVTSLVGSRTGAIYENQMQDLGPGIFPPLAGWSCLTRPIDPLTSVLVPAEDVKQELADCQEHIMYRVDRKTGCVYNVNAPFHDAWGTASVVYLDDDFPKYGVHKKKEQVVSVEDFGLPCGERLANMRKLAVIRDRCQKLRLLLLNAACDGDRLRTVVFRKHQVHDCAYDKIDEANLYIASSPVFVDQCITAEKKDC